MKNLFWIQKYRQQIFAIEILIAIIFGPALANVLDGSGWMALGFVLGIFALLEINIAFFRMTLAKVSLEKTKKTHKNVKAAHAQIKKDYQELTGEQLNRRPPPSTRKNKRTKNKKTHRR